MLFLEEPTIGLDQTGRRSVWDRLVESRDGFGAAIPLTTHDMEEADERCAELAILYAGKVAVIGKPQELKGALGPEATLDTVFRALQRRLDPGRRALRRRPTETPHGPPPRLAAL